MAFPDRHSTLSSDLSFVSPDSASPSPESDPPSVGALTPIVIAGIGL
jgi:hypothetical protein